MTLTFLARTVTAPSSGEGFFDFDIDISLEVLGASWSGEDFVVVTTDITVVFSIVASSGVGFANGTVVSSGVAMDFFCFVVAGSIGLRDIGAKNIGGIFGVGSGIRLEVVRLGSRSWYSNSDYSIVC